MIYPTSPFRVPVAANPTLDPNSQAVVANWLGQGPWSNKPFGNEFGPDDWGRPDYFAHKGDPTHVVRQDVAHNGTWKDPYAEGTTFRAPAGARPAGGVHWEALDGGVGLFYGNWCTSMWRSVDPVDGRCYMAGRMRTDGDGLPKGGERGIGQAWFGKRMGTVTYKELVIDKTIPHALFGEVRNWHGRAWGKQDDGQDYKRGGYTTNPNAPAMGGHFYLAYSPAEINALSVPDWYKVILRALAIYGWYVYDNGSAAHSLDFEGAHPWLVRGEPNPWVQFARSIGMIGPTATSGSFNIEQSGKVDWGRARYLGSR